VLAFSQACENNKAPILQVLSSVLQHSHRVLEIGGGTGQHAVHFAKHLPHLTWQSSDQPAYLLDLNARVQQANLANLPAPLALDISGSAFTAKKVDAIFTANTLHIMPWQVVEQLFQRVNEFCLPEAELCIYGPFNYNGQFTSASNASFNLHLQQRDPLMAIRDIEEVIALANKAGFSLRQDYQMPANNRLLHFSRSII
jgi:cyclopropane fatty-acyl-phospholipid synthase-like methyltransferase